MCIVTCRSIIKLYLPDATLVFTYVTTISTVLFLVVWALIIVAYINYQKRNPQAHKNSIYKLHGGRFSGYLILIFFVFVFALLFVNPVTRTAVFLSPIWFILLGFMYWRYTQQLKKHHS